MASDMLMAAFLFGTQKPKAHVFHYQIPLHQHRLSPIHMKTFAAATLTAALGLMAATPALGVACSTTDLVKLATDSNVALCQAGSGVSLLTLTSTLTSSQMMSVCSVNACTTLLATIVTLYPEDCTISGLQLRLQLVDPVLTHCANMAGASSSSGSHASSTVTVSSSNSSSSTAKTNASTTTNSSSANSTASGAKSSSTSGAPVYAAVSSAVLSVLVLAAAAFF